MAEDGAAGRRRGVLAAGTALEVLAALGRAAGPAALTELAAAARMPPAKAHRYLVSLIAAGMAVQRADGLYDLGPEAARLGMAAVARIDPVNRAADSLPALVAATGCTAMLSVWGPAGATVIRWERADPQLVTALGVGAVLPATASATGLTFVAWLPARLTAERVAAEAPDPVALARRLEQVRAEGLARVEGSLIPGLAALAAPVRDLAGGLAAVVTLVSNRPETLAPGSRAEALLRGFAA